MANKQRVVKLKNPLTPDQEMTDLLEVKEVKVTQVTPSIAEKETIMSQAQNVAQAEVQTKAVETAKEEPGMLAKAGNFLNENKWKIAGAVGVTAAAAAAFIYREEISDFIGGKVSGESAGGDAFM